MKRAPAGSDSNCMDRMMLLDDAHAQIKRQFAPGFPLRRANLVGGVHEFDDAKAQLAPGFNGAFHHTALVRLHEEGVIQIWLDRKTLIRCDLAFKPFMRAEYDLCGDDLHIIQALRRHFEKVLQLDKPMRSIYRGASS